MFCRNCGAENRSNEKFCKGCGASLTENRMQNNNGVSKRSMKKNRVIWVLLGILIFLASLLIALLLAVMQKDEKHAHEQYESYLSEADKYLAELDYERAETAYLAALEIDPKQSEPYLKLFDVYYAQGRYDEAEETLRKAKDAVSYDSASSVISSSASGSAPNSGSSSVPNSEKMQSEIERRQTKLAFAPKPSSEPTPETTQEAKKDEYSWAVEPTIEADDIYYLPETDDITYSQNELYRQHMSPYAVLKRGDTYGIIDMNGNLLEGMSYKKVSRVQGEYLLSRIEPGHIPETNQEWYDYRLDDNGEVNIMQYGDYASRGTFYYFNGVQYLRGPIDENNAKPQGVFPVRQTNSIYAGSFDRVDAYEWLKSSSGKYALCRDSELITDFAYDECGSDSDGLVAVFQSGKWGYVNETGTIVVPMEYDASWNQFAVNVGKTNEEPIANYCYSASGGYVPLCKDDQWELRDTSGNVVIPTGEFDAIRPVYEGKCWVKKDGKWGVIQLNPAEENKDLEGTAVPESEGQNIAVGRWILDEEKTMEVNDVAITTIFGNSYTYGSEMVIGADQSFSYYIGAGIGGSGTWKTVGEQLEYEITTYEDQASESGLISPSDLMSPSPNLVMMYGNYQLYWKRAEG